MIDLRAVFQQGRNYLPAAAMPDLLTPRKGRLGQIDHQKAFCADQRRGHDIFDLGGIDRGEGCVVVVRPDQHVATVLPLAATRGLAARQQTLPPPA